MGHLARIKNIVKGSSSVGIFSNPINDAHSVYNGIKRVDSQAINGQTPTDWDLELTPSLVVQSATVAGDGQVKVQRVLIDYSWLVIGII